MAKIDEQKINARHHEGVTGIVDGYLQDEPDKVKNERSLSIAVGDGSNLIAISEFRTRHNKNIPNRYSFFVTKPGADNTHVCTVLDVPEVCALISILQEIIDKE